MSKAKWKEFRDLYWEFCEKYTQLEALILREGYSICDPSQTGSPEPKKWYLKKENTHD